MEEYWNLHDAQSTYSNWTSYVTVIQAGTTILYMFLLVLF